MTVPMSLASRLTIYICMAIINFAAFYGAYVFDKNSRRKNIISMIIGLLAIAVLVFVMYSDT